MWDEICIYRILYFAPSFPSKKASRGFEAGLGLRPSQSDTGTNTYKNLQSP